MADNREKELSTLFQMNSRTKIRNANGTKLVLRFAGVYIIFLISAQKHRLWVLVRTVSSEIKKKYQNFLSENFQFLEVIILVYLNRHVFVTYLMLRTLCDSDCIRF